MLTLLIILATTQVNVDTVRHDIDVTGAMWTAGPTAFTSMSRDDRATYLLEHEPAPPAVTRHAITTGTAPVLPDAFDWLLYQTPVRDQGSCGGCWAFAVLAAAESSYRIAIEDPSLPIDLSEQFVVSCLPGGCYGGLLEPVVGQLSLMGIPDEECFPYIGRDFAPCEARCEDWKARVFRIEAWSWVVPSPDDNGDTMRSALLRGPVATMLRVHTDLWSYRGGVYEHVTGDLEGFHAVTLVGWQGDAWIVKNSWGKNWGESGYFRIREGECGIATYGVQVHVRPEDVPEVSHPPILGCGCSMVQ